MCTTFTFRVFYLPVAYMKTLRLKYAVDTAFAFMGVKLALTITP
jgi:hypothetical protein